MILTLDALGPGLGGGDGLRENELRKGCINLLLVFKRPVLEKRDHHLKSLIISGNLC